MEGRLAEVTSLMADQNRKVDAQNGKLKTIEEYLARLVDQKTHIWGAGCPTCDCQNCRLQVDLIEETEKKRVAEDKVEELENMIEDMLGLHGEEKEKFHKQLNEAIDDHKEEVTELVDNHKNEIHHIKKTHTEKLASIMEEHKDKIDEIQELRGEEKKKFEFHILDLRTKHDFDVQEIKDTHHREIEHVRLNKYIQNN